MDKQIIVFDKATNKKHSIRYDTSQKDAALKSIYVSKDFLRGEIPEKVSVAIFETPKE